MLILNISDYHELAHHFGMNLVHTTIKRGEIIWEEGKVAPPPVETCGPPGSACTLGDGVPVYDIS